MTDKRDAGLDPRANPDLFGHEYAEQGLLDTFRGGQLAHALLISGPEGVGKATLAYRFARFLLAQSQNSEGQFDDGLFGPAPMSPPSSGLRVDPDSPVFRRVMAAGHADLISIERRVDEKSGKKKGEIVVDDVRGIGQFLSLTPAEGGWRIVIIDTADDLNRNAANAVLKVLEEPPRRSLLILISHNPGRLLPTIRSRCRKIVLRPLPEEQIAGLVASHNRDVAPEDLALLGQLSEGSIGRALSLADDNGLELYRELDGLLQTLPRLDIVRLHSLGDRLAKTGAEDTFTTAMTLLRRRLSGLVRMQADPAAYPHAAGEGDWTGRLAGTASLDRWLDVWEKISRLLARVDGANLDRKQVVLNVFLTLEDAVRS